METTLFDHELLTPMEQFRHYFSLAWANIRQNKLFALFSMLVSAITCIFIYVLLQIASLISNDTPPFSNSDRVVSFLDEFYDTQGRFLDGIPAPYIASFLQGLRNYECYAICNTEFTSVFVKGKIFPTEVAFVNHDYFNVNDFDFVAGRPFSQEETWNVAKTAVISEKVAKRYFNTKSALGEQMSVQGNTYTVIGVVKDYSLFSTTKEVVNIWLPYSTNKFIPSGETVYNIDILFPPHVPKEEFKQDLVFALKMFYKNMGHDLDLSVDKVLTLKEQRLARYGNAGLYIGVGVTIALLLLIPAINIITLSESSTQNRIAELAVRRACGASKLSIFNLILFENLIVVGVGFLIGLLCVYPVVSCIESMFFRSMADGTNTTLLVSTGGVCNILIVILLCMVFSLISGGIPAYMITKQNISIMLKGGSND